MGDFKVNGQPSNALRGITLFSCTNLDQFDNLHIMALFTLSISGLDAIHVLQV